MAEHDIELTCGDPTGAAASARQKLYYGRLNLSGLSGKVLIFDDKKRMIRGS